MRTITLGKTNIKVPQNGFGALPIQRVDVNEGIKIIRKAYEGGIKFFDTARAYTDSEIKLGLAFETIDRSDIYIASKTMAKNVEDFWLDLKTTLNNLKTDYLDIYQFHCVNQMYKPNDGTNMYEAMLEAKQKGLIRHIGITTHKITIAEEIANSDLYETLQYPFSYLSSDREIALVNKCKENNIGYIAMKGLAGGIINNSKAAYGFMSSCDNVLPIWGIQKESELAEWLSFFDEDVTMDDEIKEFIAKERKELALDFCRSCGYCMPCPQGIIINQCARISQMIRRAPSENWTNEYWQKEMAKVNSCIECYQCSSKCPYGLDTPKLLKKNLEDFNNIIAGKTKI